jgi:hypothetical protein
MRGIWTPMYLSIYPYSRLGGPSRHKGFPSGEKTFRASTIPTLPNRTEVRGLMALGIGFQKVFVFPSPSA